MDYKTYTTCRKSYQEAGSLLLLEKKHACLFYKAGKGKTYPCVDAVRDINKKLNGKAKVLVLSTADAIKNMWNTEILPQKIMPNDTVTMSFNAAIQDKTKVKLLGVKWDVMIVDECHKVKANTSKTSKLVHQLAKKIPYVWGLSGTPRANNDVDIFCQFHNLCISEWGTISYTQFVNQCCDIDKKFFRGNQVVVPVGINKRYLPGWERNIALYSQRIDYDEDDTMPELNVNLVELPYEVTKQYIQAEDGVISTPEYETTLTKLAAIQKLHQAVNGFLYIYDEDEHRQIYKFQHNKKLDWLKENLTPVTTIIYRFEADLKAIEETLDEIGYTYTEIVDEFKDGDADVLLLQCSRCESFNLQMCNRMIFYTLDYSYIKYDQMIHRTWRMGQTEPVQIDILTFEKTIETTIWNTVQRKEHFADLFMAIKNI